MSILVNGYSRLMVHGVDTPEGVIYVDRMLEAGTAVVAAVAVGKGGTWHAGVPGKSGTRTPIPRVFVLPG